MALDLEPQQAFFVHSPSFPSLRVGPLFCSVDEEIADRLSKLLPKAGLDVSAIDRSIFVVVYPGPQDLAYVYYPQLTKDLATAQLTAIQSVDVYEIPVEKPDERLTLDEIKNRLLLHYENESEKIKSLDYLSAWRIADGADRSQEAHHTLYPRGSVFTAKKCTFQSLLAASQLPSNPQQKGHTITPHSNQPLVRPMEESLSGPNSSTQLTSSSREGPPGRVLPHKSHEDVLQCGQKAANESDLDAGAVVKSHSGLGEEEVVTADHSKLEMPPALGNSVVANGKEDTSEALLKQAKPLSESADCLLQCRSRNERLTCRLLKKSSSDSNIELKKLRALKDGSLVYGRLLPPVTARLVATSGVEAQEEYLHVERFDRAKEQDEKEVVPKCDTNEKEEDENRSCSTQTNTQSPEDDPPTNVCIQEVSIAKDSQPVRPVPAQPTVGECHTRSRGTLPGAANPIVRGSLIRPPQHSRSGLLLVPGVEVDRREVGDARASSKPVYLIPQTKPCYSVMDGTYGPFPLKETLSTLPDRSLLFTSEEFIKDTHLAQGANCRSLLPSPVAVHRLVNKPLPITAHLAAAGCRDHQRLPPDLVLGIGGFGITLEHVLAGKKYALKWTLYDRDILEAWSGFSHPNIVPLLAVANVTPDCYILMPRMTGDLGALIRDVGDLYSLAIREDDEKWKSIMDNLRHILASILCGMEYLHVKGYQHCDLKESNVLYLVKCSCTNSLYCKCYPQEKCDVTISDFDTLKQCRPLQRRIRSSTSPQHLMTGTLYYRSPEAHFGTVAPCCDMYSFGVMVVSICHTRMEKTKIVNDYNLAIPFSSMSVIHKVHVETAYGRELLSSLRKKCIVKHDRLEPIEEIAAACLELKPVERMTAQWLLNSDKIKLLSSSD